MKSTFTLKGSLNNNAQLHLKAEMILNRIFFLITYFVTFDVYTSFLEGNGMGINANYPFYFLCTVHATFNGLC